MSVRSNSLPSHFDATSDADTVNQLNFVHDEFSRSSLAIKEHEIELHQNVFMTKTLFTQANYEIELT